MTKIIYVTGTDTNVGKTVVTTALLYHLRQRGDLALAMKPFCSGGREDVDCLQRIQGDRITREECNPFYFRAPLAPWIAARRKGKTILFKDVVIAVREVKAKCEILLIEGAGGLLTPLGEGFCLLDLMELEHGQIIVVAANRLGTINHSLLTLNQLQASGMKDIRVVLNQTGRRDCSASSNQEILTEVLHPIQVLSLPYLGRNAPKNQGFIANVKKLKNVLAPLVG